MWVWHVYVVDAYDHVYMTQQIHACSDVDCVYSSAFVDYTDACSHLASNPGSLSWAERRAWYTLPAHAPKFPEILGIRIHL